MKKKRVLAGGTCFVGQYLKKQFDGLGYEVIVISRQANSVLWKDFKRIVDSLEDASMLINLAGKSVNCRYNEKNKSEILLSRTNNPTLGKSY